MTFTRDERARQMGTSLQLRAPQASYAELLATFGAPNATTGDADKVTAEWSFAAADGSVAVLYDYTPEFDASRLKHRKFMWHIGARTLQTARDFERWVQDALEGASR